MEQKRFDVYKKKKSGFGLENQKYTHAKKKKR